MEAAKPGQPAETTFSHVKEGDTGFKSDGLRDFFLYRDLGIAKPRAAKSLRRWSGLTSHRRKAPVGTGISPISTS